MGYLRCQRPFKILKYLNVDIIFYLLFLIVSRIFYLDYFLVVETISILICSCGPVGDTGRYGDHGYGGKWRKFQRRTEKLQDDDEIERGTVQWPQVSGEKRQGLVTMVTMVLNLTIERLDMSVLVRMCVAMATMVTTLGHIKGSGWHVYTFRFHGKYWCRIW